MSGRVEAGGFRYAAQRLVLLALFSIVLFGAAGRVSWVRGWGYVGAVLLLELLTLTLLALRAPATLNQRGSVGAGVKPFDRWFVVSWLSLSLLTPLVAGLDAVRFGWSSLPVGLFWAGVVVLVAVTLFATWAMVENEHFEQFVRIQEDRGHEVVTTGPYRLVRHPGYAAAIVGALATPAMLGSAWAFVPATLVALLFVVRTALEDRTLKTELDGYAEFAERTRFRLLPYIW